MKLHLRIDKQIINSIFIIAKNLSQDIIIGVDILSSHKCIIDFEKQELRCGASNIKINRINPPRSRFIHANYNIEIDPLGKVIQSDLHFVTLEYMIFRFSE